MVRGRQVDTRHSTVLPSLVRFIASRVFNHNNYLYLPHRPHLAQLSRPNKLEAVREIQRLGNGHGHQCKQYLIFSHCTGSAAPFPGRGPTNLRLRLFVIAVPHFAMPDRIPFLCPAFMVHCPGPHHTTGELLWAISEWVPLRNIR